MKINLSRKKRRSPMAEINVVPYIDVMLVLLVIFMITTPLLSQGVQVELPQANAQPLSQQEKEPIIISVDAQGRFYLNISRTPDQVIEGQQLMEQVAAELNQDKQNNKTRQVLVKGDQNVDYGKVMRAMVLLQQAGAPSVGLITQPLETNS
jgi:biopolymer transport protein TolR